MGGNGVLTLLRPEGRGIDMKGSRESWLRCCCWREGYATVELEFEGSTSRRHPSLDVERLVKKSRRIEETLRKEVPQNGGNASSTRAFSELSNKQTGLLVVTVSLSPWSHVCFVKARCATIPKACLKLA
jgi:hypothetical protein